jgi:hypothetical protein
MPSQSLAEGSSQVSGQTAARAGEGSILASRPIGISTRLPHRESRLTAPTPPVPTASYGSVAAGGEWTSPARAEVHGCAFYQTGPR